MKRQMKKLDGIFSNVTTNKEHENEQKSLELETNGVLFGNAI